MEIQVRFNQANRIELLNLAYSFGYKEYDDLNDYHIYNHFTLCGNKEFYYSYRYSDALYVEPEQLGEVLLLVGLGMSHRDIKHVLEVPTK